jgi:hypothetical protein
MAVPMSKTNDHGIGYSAIKSNGDMFSERWHRNYSFMDYNSIMIPEVAEQLLPYINRLPYGALETNYSQYGEIDYDDMQTLTMHTRWATCGREFVNTHPFIDQDTSLIHNGTIRNADYLKVNKISSCDSEAALQTYLEQGVSSDSSKAKKWLDILSGSWAFGILSRDSNNLRILDVVKGSSSLSYMEIEGLGRVFTTDKDDAVSVCKDMGLTFIKEPEYVTIDSMFRFNAVTGAFMETIDIKPKYVSSYTGNSNWQHGRSGSSNSNPSTNQSTSGAYTSNQRTSLEESEYPDLCTKHGGWDTNKVAKYLEDINEPLLDRLDIFDLVYDRNCLDLYESLTDALQDYVIETDVMEGFKAARKLIVLLDEQRNIDKVM